MRVTIEHREEAAGIAGSNRRYFVDTTVQFSEEERAIIKARDLYDSGFPIRSSEPLPTRTAYVGTGLMRTVGRLLIIGAIVLGLVSGLAHTSGEGLSYLMLVVGIGLEIYGWRTGRRQDKRLETPEQFVTIRDLQAGRFTVHAHDPSFANGLEDEIRTKLAMIKQLISDSAEIKTRQTFEL